MEPPSHPLTLSFRDRALERAFRVDFARGAQRHFQYVMWLGFVLYLLPGISDVVAPSPGSDTRLLIRYGVTAPLLAVPCLFGFAPTRLFLRHFQWVTTAGVSLLMLSLVAIFYVERTAPELRPMTVIGLAITVVGSHTILLQRHVYAMLAGAATVVGFVVGGLLSGPTVPSLRVFIISSFYLLIANVLGGFGSRALERFRRRDFLQRREIEHERARSERLLRNVLPEAIAHRLKGEERVADRFDEVTVLFADIVGFTPLAESMKAEELVATLDVIFSAFDDIAERHGLEKIKTIGDAYMVVGGLPVPRADHARAVAEMALEMRDVLARHPVRGGAPLKLRIGIHTGPAVAGVIGKRKFIYDLWGDTVNVASRMESHGLEDSIQLTEATRVHLEGTFALERRGAVAVKGKGEMTTWLLRGRLAQTSTG